eukprot:g12048.t1
MACFITNTLRCKQCFALHVAIPTDVVAPAVVNSVPESKVTHAYPIRVWVEEALACTAMGDVDTIEYDQEIVVDDTGYEDAEQIEYTGDNIDTGQGDYFSEHAVWGEYDTGENGYYEELSPTDEYAPVNANIDIENQQEESYLIEEDESVRFNDWCQWEKVYDPSSEEYYFFNIWTNETTWEQPDGYMEGKNKSASGKGASMPDGLILLKAVRKIQTAYRAKKARRLLNDQRKLLDLTTRLEIYSERCDLWFEQGELYYYRRDYENAIISLSKAVSNIHVSNGEDNQVEERVKPRARRKRHSEFSSFRRQIPQRSASSKLIARFQSKMRNAPGVGYLKTKFGYALRILGLSYYYTWETKCDPDRLKLAWDTLQIAYTFIENLTHPEFMLALAKCHMCQGSFQGALQLLGRIIDRAPTWYRMPEVILVSGGLLKTCKKLDQSKQYFTYVLDSHFIAGKQFGKYAVIFSLANICLVENDANGAEDGFSQAFELFPKQFKELYCHDDMSLMEWVWHPATWYHTGRMYKALGLHTLSLEAFNESLQRMEDDEKNDAHLWYEIAQSACRSGDVITACNFGDAALKLKPYESNFSEKVRSHLGSWHPGYKKTYIQPLDNAATTIQKYTRRRQRQRAYKRKLKSAKMIQRQGRIWLFWKHKREAEERADRCLKKFIQRRALQALNKWYDYTMTMVKVRNLIGRRVGGLKRSIWFEWAKISRINAAIRRTRKKAASVIQRALRAYNARTALMRAKKQREEQEERARIQLRRFLQRHALKCLNSWRSYVIQMRRVKDLMRRVLNGT